MSRTITMDDAGRIVLPKPLRERFRLRGGDKLTLETVGDHLELKPLDDQGELPLLKKCGLLVVPACGEACDAAEAVRIERDERGDRTSRDC